MDAEVNLKKSGVVSNQTVVAFICATCRPFWLLLSVMVMVVIIRAIDRSLRPYLLKMIIDVADTSSTSDLWQQVCTFGFLYISLLFLLPMTAWFKDYCINFKMIPNLKRNIANHGFESLLHQSYSFFQNNFAGSLSSKINDLTIFIPELVIVMQNLLTILLMVIIAVFTLWQVNPIFGLGLLIWSLLLTLLTVLFAPRLTQLSDQMSEKASFMFGKLVDSLNCILSVHIFSRHRHEAKLFADSVTDTVAADQKLQLYSMKIWSLYDYLMVMALAINFYLLFKGRMEGTVTAGDFVVVLSINTAVMDALWQLSKHLSSFMKICGNVKQALRTLDVSPEIQDKVDAKPLIVSQGGIVFDNIHFNYQGSPSLFNKKSVVIVPGQKVGLVGYSGSGKTTFVNLLLRLFELTEGRILIDGQDISTVTQTSLRASIAMIPQEPALFHRSLMENIRYGRLDASDEQVIEASKLARAHEFIQRLPAGYQTLVGERGIKLSGGQRQRIAIARAILKNSPILILDEATSQLDSMTETQIQEGLWQVMQGKTTLAIAHRLSTLLHMDRIIVIDNGTIVEDGTHQTLLSQGGLYKTLWEAQVVKRHQERLDSIKKQI